MKLYSEMLSDCKTIDLQTFASEESFDVRIFDDGRLDKIIPAKKKDIKSLSNGIIDLFLMSVHLHEGGENQATDDCNIKKVESEGSIQLIKVRSATFDPKSCNYLVLELYPDKRE